MGHAAVDPTPSPAIVPVASGLEKTVAHAFSRDVMFGIGPVRSRYAAESSSRISFPPEA